MIRKAAGPFYRTISGVRLCLELEEPQGPKGLDESEDEAAGAASGQKRPKKAKKGKGAARGSEWKHFVDWEEEGLGYPRNRTTFPHDDGGAILPAAFSARARREGIHLSPLEQFRVTFSPEMRARVLKHTNLYAAEYSKRERLRKTRKWPPRKMRRFKPLGECDPKGSMAFLQKQFRCPPMLGARRTFGEKGCG